MATGQQGTELGDPNRLPAHVRKNLKWFYELHYWKTLLRDSSEAATNNHYERCYTDLFNIDRASYREQRILDIGCGPLGSLEWATDAAECIGVDPLADKYLELCAQSGKMTHVACGAENLPFPDASFDTVSSFNSLDHVDNYKLALQEICRVCRPGGKFLLIVEVNHVPTITEPRTLSSDIVDDIPGFLPTKKFINKPWKDHNVYESAFSGKRLSDPKQPGVLCALLERVY